MIRRRAAQSLSVIGLVLGVWHLGLAISGIVVFRNREPIGSWITMIAGPLVTLPAAVVSFWAKRFAGWWLMIGAVVSSLAFFSLRAEEDVIEAIPLFVAMMSGPMLVLGATMLIVASRKGRKSETGVKAA